MRSLPLSARIYVSAVVLAGAAIVVWGAAWLTRHDPTQWPTVLTLSGLVIGLTLVSSPLRHSVATHREITISVTMPVNMASVLLLGPVGAPIVAATMGVSRGAWFHRLFNGAMGAVTAFVAGKVYLGLGGHILTEATTFSWNRVLLPMLVSALVSEAVNGVLLVTVVALTQKVSPVRIWFGTMAESAFPMFIYSIFGLLLAVVWSYAGPISALLVLAPLMVARWVFAEFAARQEAYEATMRSLIKSVETKDLYTRGHSERVSRASVLIGRRAGMREDRVLTLRYAGMLHDVGKLGVPTSVLQKAGKLTEDEFEAIQQHTVRGREITKDLEFLGEAIEGIHLHHERIDGRGYPLGLKGSEIPEFARIIAVADAFDSMTTTRSYRGARSVEDAVDELRKCRGSQFDPVMVEALVAAIAAEPWDASDTLPVELPQPFDSAPSFASDDDDPTAADRLGLPSAAPRDAAELAELDGLAGPTGGERP
jgi:hypothetical protein